MRLEWALAALTALLAFAVYHATMFPGLSGSGDAAKFAFVGKVLGTPHEPGYPLYILVSHLFSYLPIGSLAYRSNLLSAVLSAGCVGVGYFLVRRIGGGRVAAMSATLGMAFGQAFWSKALYAKTYPLNAVLVAGGMLLLMRWGSTRKERDLLLAVGLFALSAANHLIVVALLPVLLLYPLLVDARAVLRPRTMGLAAVIVMMGLSIYGVIPLRTLQAAPYLEARATDLRELLDVMMARRYWNEIGAFSIGTLISSRLPAVAGLVAREFSWFGLPLLAAGVLVLMRTRRNETLLLCLGALGVVVLTANMSSNEDDGFLLPVFVLLWPVAGIGLQALCEAAAKAPRAVATSIVVIASLAVPARQVAANYGPNDHSRRLFEIRYFDALFEMLPQRSVFVGDAYAVNMMLLYKLHGEQAAGTRDIRWIEPSYKDVAQAWLDHYEVFAFAQGQRALADYGFQFEPVALLGETVSGYLPNIREGWTVVIVALPDSVPALNLTDTSMWSLVGATPTALAPPDRPNAPYALIGAMGAHGAGLQASHEGGLELSVNDGDEIGHTGAFAPAAIRVTATDASAVITVGGAVTARIGSGAVIAVINPKGGVEILPLDPRSDVRVPFDMRALPLYRLTRAGACADVGNLGWQDASNVIAGDRAAIRFDNYHPFNASATFYVGSDSALAPSVTRTRGRGRPVMTVSTFAMNTPAGREAFLRAASADGVPQANRPRASPLVSRIRITVNDEGEYVALTLELGQRLSSASVRAEVDQDSAPRATVCGSAAKPS
jgi:hypothetical protein